jgi:hypothetical protein
MKVYTIYKIDSHFKIFFNFNTGIFDNRENKLTSENFNISKTHCDNACANLNYKETLKNWGAQNYSHVKKTTI